MLKIKTSLDWTDVESEIENLTNTLPEFSSDIRRIARNIGTMVSQLGKLEVKARATKRPSAIKACEDQAEKINQELKQIHNLHLMLLLSR